MASTWTWYTHQSHVIHYLKNSKIKQPKHGSLMQTRLLRVQQIHLQHQLNPTRNTGITTIIADTIATIVVVIATVIDLDLSLRKLERSDWKFLPMRGYYHNMRPL